MKARITMLAALAVLLACPATAWARNLEIGVSQHLGVGTFYDSGTSTDIPWWGPKVTLNETNDQGWTGQYSTDGGTWTDFTDGTHVTFASPPTVRTIQFRYVDASDAVMDTFTVWRFALDDVGPSTSAPSAVHAHRLYPKAAFRFRLNDLGSTQDTVTIKIKTRAGKVVQTCKLGAKQINAWYTYKVRLFIPKGRYRWYVYAVDKCGNAQVSVGHNALTVQ